MDNYISVSQINSYIKNIFDAEELLQNIFIYGEVGNYSISNGIAYFNLKDENGLIQCVLFNAKMFFTPKIGDMILVKGSVNYYAKGGKLSFQAYSIQEYGKGMLYEKFLELKNRLEQKRYFDIEHKKQIPNYIKRIGVVSSETGAVIQDIIDITRRRNNGVDIVLFPVKVQGLGAENDIAKGINFFSEYNNVDVVIVARGGGSLEDLQPFNTEIVADAVYNCKKPIVSAVGHETDYTICDFVSDLRAPTPSAGAELVVWEKKSVINYTLNKLNDNYLKLLSLIKNNYKYLNTINKTIEYDTNKINFLIDKINKLNNANFVNLQFKINNYDKQVEYLEKILIQNNPQKFASKGYFKILKNNNVIIKLDELNVNDLVKVESLDAVATFQVKDIKGVKNDIWRKNTKNRRNFK